MALSCNPTRNRNGGRTHARRIRGWRLGAPDGDPATLGARALPSAGIRRADERHRIPGPSGAGVGTGEDEWLEAGQARLPCVRGGVPLDCSAPVGNPDGRGVIHGDVDGRDPTFLRVRGTRHSTAAVATRARDLAGPGPFGGDLDRPAWAQAVGPSDGNRSLGPAPSTRSSI